MNKLFLFLTVFGLWALQASAQVPLAHFGLGRDMRDAIPARMQIVVWNIHKGTDDRMTRDFGSIAANADITLFQEAIDQSVHTHELSAMRPDYRWSMTPAFLCYWICQSVEPYNYSTGVSTGSNVHPSAETGWVSPVAEPLLNTPKSILVSNFHIEGSDKILAVANIHAINFVFQDAYEKHIDQLVMSVRLHEGPIVVAGDFNTWDGGRLEYAVNRMNELGLHLIKFNRDGNGLDQVFVRGLDVEEAREIDDVDSSDHKPLVLRLSVLN